ncbi:MAG: TAXI family TRAP transporter solute-binding subunit [Geminicoccaceae bacterium]
MKKLALAFGASLLSLGIASGSMAAEERFITIGTGGQTGVYYVVGQSICKLVNRGAKDHGIKCTAPSTGGSIANINAIKEGSMDMGVAQSDWQYHGYNGTSKFEESGAFPDLRAVFSVHPEPFTVVARSDAGINTFDDLKGKRVNIGNPGSGQRGTMEVTMGAKWAGAMTTSCSRPSWKPAEQSAALGDNNKVDDHLHRRSPQRLHPGSHDHDRGSPRSGRGCRDRRSRQ